MDDFSHYKKIHCIGIGGIGMSAIVCIPPVRGELAASDRLLNLLAAIEDRKSVV